MALGPLCDFFSGFETAAGITATGTTSFSPPRKLRSESEASFTTARSEPGAGLKRLLELAVKRLRATTCTQVSVIASGTD